MKRLLTSLLVLIVICFVCSMAFADKIEGGSQQDQTQSQIGVNKNSNFNLNQSNSKSSAVSKSSSFSNSKSNSLAVQSQSVSDKNKQDVSVGGDSTENKVYANQWPSIGGAEGVNTATGSSIFGSLGLSSTEEYKKYIPQIQAIIAIPDEVMNKEEKAQLVKVLVGKLMGGNRTQRFLAVGWETHGKNLLNLFGLLAHDSFWAEGQKPLQCKSDMK